MSPKIPGDTSKKDPTENPAADQWQQMAEEAHTEQDTPTETDKSSSYKAWLESKPQGERTGDDLIDAVADKDAAFQEYYRSRGDSGSSLDERERVYDAIETAQNTVKGIKEAREKYLKNTPEQNYELASKFGKIESAGFDQPVPKAVGERMDHSWSAGAATKEVYPQLEGESDAEYTLRLDIIQEESRRHEQGDRLTDANIAMARAFKEYADTDVTAENFDLVKKRYDKAKDMANFAKRLHSEGKI